MKPEESSWKTV